MNAQLEEKEVPKEGDDEREPGESVDEEDHKDVFGGSQATPNKLRL